MVFYEKKISGKDRNFWILGFTTLIAPGDTPVDETLEIRRLKEVKETYAEFFQLDSRGIRDIWF